MLMRIYFTLGICMFLNTAFPQNNKVQEPEVVTRCTLRPVIEFPVTFTIKDQNDGSPVPRATVSVFRPDKNDSVHLVANDSGSVWVKLLGRTDKYVVSISTVGYVDTSFLVDRAGEYEIILNKHYMEIKPVVLSSLPMICCRCYKKLPCYRVKHEKRVVNEASVLTLDIQNDNFKIFPNPSLRGSSAVIEFESLNQENSQVRIFSMNGQLVKALPVSAVKGKNKLRVNIDNRWPSGTYIFQLSYAKGGIAASGKVIIQ